MTSPFIGRQYSRRCKPERGGRIFPVSDNAQDVVAAFKHYLNDRKVQIRTNTRVIGIKVEKGRVTAVRTEQGEFPAGAVILATGGASFPGTGSTGDGYRMAEEVGHTIKKLRPALVPLVVEEKETAGSMQGVSLRNVRLTAFRGTADKIDTSSISSDFKSSKILKFSCSTRREPASRLQKKENSRAFT